MDCQKRRRPLAGRTILVTRPEDAQADLAARLRTLGAKVLNAPVIRTAPPRSWSRLDAALRRLDGFDAAVFASARAVESFFRRGSALGLELRSPRRVFAVGPATGEALRRRGWQATVARTHRAEGLAAAMGRVRGWRILLPRAQTGRPTLPRLLREKGARVQPVTAYRTVPDPRGLSLLRKAVRPGDIAAVTFTSESTVEHFLAQLPAAARRQFFSRAVAASIGPITTAALKRRGVSPAVESPRATMAAFCAAIARHFDAR